LHLISRKHLLKHSLPPFCTERFLYKAIASILPYKRKRSYFPGESEAPRSQRVSLRHGTLFRKPSVLGTTYCSQLRSTDLALTVWVQRQALSQGKTCW